jgi:opacity protein-like surface antigen
MKKLYWMILLFLAFAGMAAAQVPQPFSLYAGGAVSIPQAPDAFKSGFKTGYHGAIGIGYKVMPNLQVIGKVEYHTFKFDFQSLTGLEGGTNKMLLYGADGRYSVGVPSAPLKPYIIGGAGLANIKQSEFSGSDPLATSILNSVIPESQTKFYYNIGGGVELKSGPAWSMYAQVRYVSIGTEGGSSSFVPITLGLKFF